MKYENPEESEQIKESESKKFTPETLYEYFKSIDKYSEGGSANKEIFLHQGRDPAYLKIGEDKELKNFAMLVFFENGDAMLEIYEGPRRQHPSEMYKPEYFKVVKEFNVSDIDPADPLGYLKAILEEKTDETEKDKRKTFPEYLKNRRV